jgi:hypothetical protein
MGDYLVSVDPGKRACGVAVWTYATGKLVWASWVRLKPEVGQERAEIWGDLGRLVQANVAKWQPWGLSLILEIPQVYEGPQDEDKNDLLDLAGVQGAIVAACKAASPCNTTVEWSPTPREWKGQLPKEISQARVDAKLSPEEKSRIEWPAKSYRHNVYDALHLGLVHLEREGLR